MHADAAPDAPNPWRADQSIAHAEIVGRRCSNPRAYPLHLPSFGPLATLIGQASSCTLAIMSNSIAVSRKAEDHWVPKSWEFVSRLSSVRLRSIGLLLLGAASLASCRGGGGARSDDKSESSPMQLTVRDDTKDLWLTWVDSAGDFRVTEAIDQVPAEARQQVRVVVTSQSAGTQDPVFVANLQQKNADGTYPVSTMARSAWEEIGATKRKARIEALAPVASQAGPEPSSATSTRESLVAVIYGAKWCGACREAERYLKQKGISVLEKDVDQNPQIQAELRAKLTRAKLPPTSSIPIIDIGGKILVGFSQAAVDSALRAVAK